MMSMFGYRCRHSFLVLVGVVLALLASGCMWGVVRDADTGKPLSGVRVTYEDSQRRTANTTTDAGGFFGFGAPASAAPAMGSVTFTIDAPGYQTVPEARTVAYDDNPGATLADPTSFKETQAFSITRGPGGYHNAVLGFGITFPAGWDVQESADKLDVVAIGPPSSPGSCGVSSGPYPKGIDLMLFVDDMLSSIEKSTDVSNFKIYKETAVKVNDMPAVRADYSFDVKVNSGDFKMEMSIEYLTYVLAENYTGYAISCFASLDEFDKDVAEFDKIAESFRLE